jgi:integrase
MAIRVGTNDLRMFRRHVTGCPKFPGESFQPISKKDQKTDACLCPIWCRGYLANETENLGGKLRAKRVRASLGVTDWASAHAEVSKLYERGSLPRVAEAKPEDNSVITVVNAVKRYLESRKGEAMGGASLDPIVKDTHDHYASLLEQRLIPYCVKSGIAEIRTFENADECRKFTESWRQLRRNVGAVLEMTTRTTELARFRTFLKFCLENKWIAENGAKNVKIKKTDSAEEMERYSLELSEYRQMLNAPVSNHLTELENRETLVATELMRWCGLRISDAHKFNESEIIPDESGIGFNASFIMQKTRKRCVVPIPDHVVGKLKALPGRIEGGKKYFFTCSYSALRERVDTLALRAQTEAKFLHPFSPHCLRHTFAIQHLNQGTDIALVSKWLGHKNVAITIEHYSNWIRTTRKLAEEVSREANARMLAETAAA